MFYYLKKRYRNTKTSKKSAKLCLVLISHFWFCQTNKSFSNEQTKQTCKTCFYFFMTHWRLAKILILHNDMKFIFLWPSFVLYQKYVCTLDHQFLRDFKQKYIKEEKGFDSKNDAFIDNHASNLIVLNTLLDIYVYYRIIIITLSNFFQQ